MLRLDELNWVKAGIEFVEAERCCPWWSQGVLGLVDHAAAARCGMVRLRLSRHGSAVRVEWADGAAAEDDKFRCSGWRTFRRAIPPWSARCAARRSAPASRRSFAASPVREAIARICTHEAWPTGLTLRPGAHQDGLLVSVGGSNGLLRMIFQASSSSPFSRASVSLALSLGGHTVAIFAFMASCCDVQAFMTLSMRSRSSELGPFGVCGAISARHAK